MILKVKQKFISLSIAFLMMTSMFNVTASASAETSEKKSTMQSYVEAMQPGWNLGNTFDATGSETSWGNPLTTKALIDQIAAEGYKSIRIPITWKHRMGDAPDYIINKEFMDRVQEVVDWSLDAGLYVMINLHHDTGWVINMETQHDEVVGRFNAIWTQVSQRFKDYPDKLMFESINEPRFSNDWGKDTPKYFEMLDELNTSFHSIVRKSGGNNATRPLVLPTVTCSGSQVRMNELSKTINKLKDKNIIATIHYYGYWPFSVNIAGATTFNNDTKNDIIQTFDRAYNTFVANGIPVVVGEYGLLGFDSSLGTIEHGEILKYFEYMNYYAREKGLTLMLWDNGQHFNRRELKWGDKELYNIIMAGIKGRSSYALTDSIYIKKDTNVEDSKIQLILNGNTLTDLRIADKVLERGTDYELNNDMLTIKAGFLKTLVAKELGNKVTITCKFSAGADWNINIIYYDTPVLKSISGFDTTFSIPTAFNADSLATMEAVYKSGGNAGPQNWTSFKEFNATFVPSYETNEIKLKQEFFKEVNDGEVLLKMHFWSGDIIEYSITKEGSKIVGVSSNEPEEEKAVIADESDSKTTDTTSEPSPKETPQDVKSNENNNTLKYLVLGILVIILLSTGMISYMKMKRK